MRVNIIKFFLLNLLRVLLTFCIFAAEIIKEWKKQCLVWC